MNSQLQASLKGQRRRYSILIYVGMILISIGILISMVTLKSFSYSFLPLFIICGLAAIGIGVKQRRNILLLLQSLPPDEEEQSPAPSRTILSRNTTYPEEVSNVTASEQFKESWRKLMMQSLPPLPEYTESSIPEFAPPPFHSGSQSSLSSLSAHGEPPPSYEVATAGSPS